MPDLRAFAVPKLPEPRQVELSPEESHHLVVVHRARPGAPVVAFDGHGREWQCALEVADKRTAVLRVQASLPVRTLPFQLTLAQALPKGPTMDAIVRKATEIGTHRIVPLETERTQVHLEADRFDRKLDKWRTAALEACKQCGNPWLPEVAPVQSLNSFLEESRDCDLALLASLEPDARVLRPVLDDFTARQGRAPHRITWLIGPEGDFSANETHAAIAAGFVPVSLGPLVLRCETAATYALSIVSYELLARAAG